MKTIENFDRIAWFSSIGALGISVLLGVFFLFVTMKSIPKTPTLNDQQKQMLQRKIMLQARIELCAMRDRGELPEKSTQCDKTERQNLDAYRQEIREIDRQLRGSTSR